jgi:hypothetical protein
MVLLFSNVVDSLILLAACYFDVRYLSDLKEDLTCLDWHTSEPSELSNIQEAVSEGVSEFLSE